MVGKWGRRREDDAPILQKRGVEAIINDRYIGKNADLNTKQSLLAFIKPHITLFIDQQQPWGYDAPTMLPPGNH
ncbi:MAG: hypothetical protein A2Z14_02405 [Chloroflexi bacterium RBG_16_48_8]|nr:MAG: hypothetical protein A2Z14_02405 [Chloroflexi bacterium RBG_16_48_8]